jgi:hypothetical protein
MKLLVIVLLLVALLLRLTLRRHAGYAKDELYIGPVRRCQNGILVFFDDAYLCYPFFDIP